MQMVGYIREANIVPVAAERVTRRPVQRILFIDRIQLWDIKRDNSSLKILVAEDEPELLRFYKVLLEDQGHEVLTSRDGEECLDAYRTGSKTMKEGFDLVILDHRMPRMS